MLIVIFSLFLSSVLGDVGVNDDFYLNIDSTFTCPYPPVTPPSSADDDSASADNLGVDYPAFVFFYVWMCFMTVAPLLFFAYNHRIQPQGEVKPFTPESKFIGCISPLILPT